MNGFGVGDGGVLWVAVAELDSGFEDDEVDLLGWGSDGFRTGSSGSSVMVTIDGDWRAWEGKLA